MIAAAGSGAVIDDVGAIASKAFQLVKRSDYYKSCGIAIPTKRYTESRRGDTGNNKLRGKMGENVLSTRHRKRGTEIMLL